QSTPFFDNTAQLMDIVTRQFGFPEFKDWPGYSEYSSNPSLSCEGFKVEVKLYEGHLYSISVTDPEHRKIMADRRKADLAKKREGFKL
ncbi:MAG TPA: hypothetical protein VFY40_26950, partial [Blastocatellia bacterium]|nr:hypothetical protein [Blastocatellia bacterium]